MFYIQSAVHGLHAAVYCVLYTKVLLHDQLRFTLCSVPCLPFDFYWYPFFCTSFKCRLLPSVFYKIQNVGIYIFGSLFVVSSKL